MSTLTHQKGFSIVEIVFVVAVLGVIGFLGYTFYSNSHTSKDPVADSSQSATVTDVTTAPNVSSTADLDKAQAVLDQTNPDSNSDSSQLELELSNF